MPRGEEERQEVDLEMSEEPVDPSEEEFELEPENHLQSLLEQESEKSKEFLDQLRRLQAEFENYRKRIDSRFAEAARFAGESILLKVIDVRDNIKRALEVDFTRDPDSARMGIEAILKQMDKLLSSEDVRPIESLGKIFDPYYQHAVHTNHDLEKPDGLITEEYQEGFMYKEKVLRPAVVCVNRHVVGSATDDEVKPVDNDKGEQE
jgi:molecular chaperone GrpE